MATLTQSNVAETILSQLGGNKFIVMTGAYNLMKDGNALLLRFKGSKKANYLRIDLTASDLYKMTFGKIGKDYKVVSEIDGIYFDQLQKIFTSQTGLYTSL